jgi:single-strand DNA-binding protein
MGLQLANVIGNATKDAELKVSREGVSYTTFRIAVSGYNEQPTFYNVIVFGRYGEVLQEQITKGREIFVSGKLEINEKGYVSVVADHVELLRYPKSKEPVKTEEVKKEEPKKAAPAKKRKKTKK